jgi:DNA-directed RNA polymerase subunit RPC12/RpoP
MSPGASKNFACPHCDKRFQWATKIADRRVKCPNCEKRIRVPTVPGRVAEAIDPLPPKPAKAPAPEADTYDLDLTGLDDDQVERPPTPAQQAAAQTGRCPACNQSIKPNAVICIKCGYNLKKGKRMQTQVRDDEDEQTKSKTVPVSVPGGAMASVGTSTISRALEDREDEVQASRFIDLWLPIILLAIGFGFTFFNAWLFYDPAFSTIPWYVDAAVSSGLQVVLMAPLMLVAAIITVKIMDTSFGPLMVGVLKLTSIAIGPLAFADFILGWVSAVTLGFGTFVAVAIYLTICGPFLYWMFDLDYAEIMVTLVAIIILRLFIFFGILAMLLGLF